MIIFAGIMNSYKPEELIPFKTFHVGEHIKDELEYLGMTQKELSSRSGIAPNVINEIIKGKRNLNAHTALAISDVINIPAEMLMRLQIQYELDCLRILQRSREDKQHVIVSRTKSLKPSKVIS